MPQTIPEFLGALERKIDPRDFPLAAAQAPITRPVEYLPNMDWFVRNYQGQTTFCGEHAGTHLKQILDYYATGKIGRKNPRYGTIKLKTPSSSVYDGFAVDAGTDMRSIFKWLQKVGADDFEPLENDVFLPAAQYVDPSVVTPAMDQVASTSLISSYAFGTTDFESLCQYIYQNRAVLLLIKCDSGFWGTATPTFTTPTYGHFVVGYAYDANGIYVVDSADPNDAFAFKYVAKQFIQPQFFLESGTGLEIVASVKHALTAGQISLAQQILNDIAAAVSLIQKAI